MKKKYEVSQEIKDVAHEYFAMAELRDKYIAVVWGFRKAVKCTKAKTKLHYKLWRMVYGLYPELKKAQGLSYNHSLEVLEIKNKPKTKGTPIKKQ